MHPASGARREKPRMQSSRSKQRRLSTPFSIVLTLILCPLVISASPPDPSWIAGIYDGADGDDIVGLVDDAVVVATILRPFIPPLPCSHTLVVSSSPSIVCEFPAGEATRAPPL